MNHSHRDGGCAHAVHSSRLTAPGLILSSLPHTPCGAVSHFLMSPYAGPDRFRMRALDFQARIMRNLARQHVQQVCPAQTVGHQAVPHSTYPMGDPTPYKRALSGQPDEPCFPYQARGGHRGGAAGTPWRLRLVPPDAARVATVYTSAPKRRRETVFADLCTLLRSHVCPQRRNSVHK